MFAAFTQQEVGWQLRDDLKLSWLIASKNVHEQESQ